MLASALVEFNNRPAARHCRTTSKLVLLSVMALILAGPTPGNVGACGERSASSTAVDYCRERERRLCTRNRMLGELTTAEEEECRSEVDELCPDNLVWGCTPPPAEKRRNVCLDALLLPERRMLPVDEIPECRNLCPELSDAG